MTLTSSAALLNPCPIKKNKMTKSKEWLIFNAVKCWLHYCSTTTEYTEEYYKLRDEYEALLNPNDEPVEEFKDAPTTTTKPTRKRPYKA
jgi:hypothetical protein